MDWGCFHSENLKSLVSNIRGSRFLVSHEGGEEVAGKGGRRMGMRSCKSVSLRSPSGLSTV